MPANIKKKSYVLLNESELNSPSNLKDDKEVLSEKQSEKK